MKHSEDKDPAWDLLKNARKTEPAGNFTQNVMREIRQLDQAPEHGWFSLRWAAAFTAVAAVALGAFMVLKQPDTDTSDLTTETAAATPAPVSYEEEITIEEFAEELEELAYLSDLMAVPDTSLLADEDLAALLF